MLEAGALPVIDQLAKSTGTDATGYMTEIPGVSAFVLEGTVYHTYATTVRGGEFLMGYYGILDPGAEGARRVRRVRVLDPAGTTSTTKTESPLTAAYVV